MPVARRDITRHGWPTSGARVTAVDASDAMVRLARERVGDAARVVRADLAAPLPFADGSFDAVLSSLTLHYVEDWSVPLREFARVLRPRGRLVLSTHHPLMTASDVADYFAVTLIEEQWPSFGDPVTMRFYHRPLERITADVVSAGFALRGLHEPRPLPGAMSAIRRSRNDSARGRAS